MRPSISRTSLSRVFGSVVVLAIATAACGGKASSLAAAGEDASAQLDAGPGPRPPDCPSSIPSSGAPCTKDGVLCEYGDDFNPLCNTVRGCSSGRWGSPISYSNTPKCPSQPPSNPTNP